MSLSYLQLRLKQNEEDFARISNIDLDNHVKVQQKMPAENNNPWSGELKAKRQKSRESNKEEWDEDEWEWEEEEEEEPEIAKDEEGKAQITITENLVTIDRSKVDWSDDEFEEDDTPTGVPPPPPAPPPPPPGMPGDNKVSSIKSEKLEQLKKKPAKRPDWNDLMKEIGQFKSGSRGLLKRTQTDDRSKPMLTKTKVKGVFVYESEKHSKDADILKEISTGIKLKHVKCNDRSKPCLRGIKSFKRQITKEEKLDKGFSFGDDDNIGELEDLDKLKDDLEATKQLLELEVRSKSLLEKDNKRLQQEIERLKVEFASLKTEGNDTPAPPDILNNILTRERKESFSKERRESLIDKRRSIAADSIIPEILENNHEEAHVPEQVIEEMDELKEEAEEAKKLAEEWEAKYKEMQKQMEMLDGGAGMYGKKTSAVERPGLQRMQSTNSDGVDDLAHNRASVVIDDNDEDWMQRREIQQLQTKLKNMKDKKEIIVRERQFLNERIDNLKDCIAKEFEARKTLKKDIREMNAAFKEEMAEIDHNDQIKKDLEDCWYDESDLVDNPYAAKEEEIDEEAEEFAALLEKDDDMEENIDEILLGAEECEEIEEDTGAELFDKFKSGEESDIEDEEPDASEHAQMTEYLSKKIEHQQEHVKLMRHSNFGLKSKIDILYDILQTQKEKHYDLKQELNRMLSDV